MTLTAQQAKASADAYLRAEGSTFHALHAHRQGDDWLVSYVDPAHPDQTLDGGALLVSDAGDVRPVGAVELLGPAVTSEARRVRLLMDAAYLQRLRELIGPSLLTPDLPSFDRELSTSRVRVAVKGAAWQGYDAGRFSDSPHCPYPAHLDPATNALRRAWYVGLVEGRRVTPRPALQPVAHTPITFTP